MAAYDDTYRIYDLEKKHPGASASRIREIMRAEDRLTVARWDEEDRIKYGVPLDRCPTTGRNLEEEVKSHADQDGEELDAETGVPGVRALDEKLDVSFVNEKTQEARAKYHE